MAVRVVHVHLHLAEILMRDLADLEMSLAGAMGCSTEAAPARKLMTEVRRANEVAMKNRLLQARKAGELPKAINVEDYTRYIFYASRGTLDPNSKRIDQSRTKANSTNGTKAPLVLEHNLAS
jgi:hypothetical protein